MTTPVIKKENSIRPELHRVDTEYIHAAIDRYYEVNVDSTRVFIASPKSPVRQCGFRTLNLNKR